MNRRCVHHLSQVFSDNTCRSRKEKARTPSTSRKHRLLLQMRMRGQSHREPQDL